MSAVADVAAGIPHDLTSVATVAQTWEAALRARAPAQHAGTPMVRKLAAKVSRQLGLRQAERLAVDVCAQVRDIGMIKLPDSVVLKTGSLSPEDWALLNRHPELGAELLQSSATMAHAAELVRAHHERWDGEGYPDGLRGEAIPLPSRVVAVCDAFVAIATDRPHRRGIGAERAMEYIVGGRGAQFDPRTVDSLQAVITAGTPPDGGLRSTGTTRLPRDRRPARRGPSAARANCGARSLEFDVVPAFGPALERALETAGFAGPLGGCDLASVIESDIGLTVAILRAAQGRSEAPVASVPGRRGPAHARRDP